MNGSIVITENTLEINNLNLSFGEKIILKDVNFRMKKNKTLALIGESGSGKTVCVKSILQLNPGSKTIGEILFNGSDLLCLSESEITKIRGKKIAMIFQNPQSGLNPVLTIGKQIIEVIQYHHQLEYKTARSLSLDYLSRMKIINPEMIMIEYPYQQSGGMCQRIMIAIALSCGPEILIADEPTSSLDTINQKIVIDILKDLKQNNNLSLLFVTHNINLAKELADDVAIMKSGEIVESGIATDIFETSNNNYTQQLIRSSI
jgi:ABC-type dipeptide/oligopeptide/nickel transport system ATPase component